MNEFVRYLEENTDQLYTIFSNDTQKRLFRSYCQETYPDGLPNEIVESLFEKISHRDNFRRKLSEFKDTLDTEISEHKITQLKKELQEKWQNLSDSTSPKEWSNKANFPILLLFESEMATARRVFEILNERSQSFSNVERLGLAIQFLENPLFQKLKNAEFIHQKFVDKILKKYVLLIDTKNLEPVVQKLKSKVDSEPYAWADELSRVYQVVEEYAKSCYRETGYNTIFEEIDRMTPEMAKEYLKDLIKDHMDVGLAIISNEKTAIERNI